jgi:hypothetical protein
MILSYLWCHPWWLACHWLHWCHRYMFGIYSTISMWRINRKMKLAGMSPRLKRCHSVECTGISSNRSVCAPQTSKNQKCVIQSSDNQCWYKNASKFVQRKKPVKYVWKIFTDQVCSFSKCANKYCKTCDIHITRNYCKSNLTIQELYTQTVGRQMFECCPLNWMYSMWAHLCQENKGIFK